MYAYIHVWIVYESMDRICMHTFMHVCTYIHASLQPLRTETICIHVCIRVYVCMLLIEIIVVFVIFIAACMYVFVSLCMYVYIQDAIIVSLYVYMHVCMYSCLLLSTNCTISEDLVHMM